MVFAAGFGTRLLPYTKVLPKPLFPLFDKPVAEHILILLKKAGVTDVMINLHHKPEALRAALGNGRRFGINLHYSHEDTILGTAGGLDKAQDFFERDEDFYLINADIFATVDIQGLMAAHKRSGALATMAVMKYLPEYRGRYMPVHSKGSRLTTDTAADEALFIGIHAVSGRIFSRMNTSIPCIYRTYLSLLNEGIVIGTHHVSGLWYDMGTLDAYLDTHFSLLKQETVMNTVAGHSDRNCWFSSGTKNRKIHEKADIKPPVFIGEGVIAGPGSVIGPAAVVGRDCVLGAGVKIESSVVWAGSIIPDGAAIVNTLYTGI